jgi:membrane-bound serine protease (ClpP class)
MKTRLVIAIVTNVLEEAALVAAVLWGLPRLGIYVPLWVLIIVMVAWAVCAVIIYRMGSRALRKKPVTGMTAMVGGKARVVTPLAPEGFIRMKGELWRATTADNGIEVGDEVSVVSQDGLKLIVCKNNSSDSKDK